MTATSYNGNQIKLQDDAFVLHIVPVWTTLRSKKWKVASKHPISCSEKEGRTNRDTRQLHTNLTPLTSSPSLPSARLYNSRKTLRDSKYIYYKKWRKTWCEESEVKKKKWRGFFSYFISLIFSSWINTFLHLIDLAFPKNPVSNTMTAHSASGPPGFVAVPWFTGLPRALCAEDYSIRVGCSLVLTLLCWLYPYRFLICRTACVNISVLDNATENDKWTFFLFLWYTIRCKKNICVKTKGSHRALWSSTHPNLN